MSRKIQSLMTAIVVPALLAGAGSIASGEVVIGSFAGGVAETGWGGFSGGFVPLGDAVNTTTDFDTDGDGGALEMEAEGFAFGQVFSFTTAGNETAFFDNSLLVFDIIFRGTPTDPAEGGFNELFQVSFNSQTGGFTSIQSDASGAPLAGFGTGVTPVGFAPGTPDNPATVLNVAIDYSAYRDSLGGDPGSFLEIIFTFNDQNRPFKAIDNVRLAVIPEPASLALMGLGTLAFAGRRRRR